MNRSTLKKVPVKEDDKVKEDALLFKSIYLLITILSRTYILIVAPEGTLFRSYIWPVYLIYSTMTCFLLLIAVYLSDMNNVVHNMLVMSAFFAIYDTSFHIYQSLFDVFIRTGVSVFIIVLLQRIGKFLFLYCRCCFCCYWPPQ